MPVQLSHVSFGFLGQLRIVLCLNAYDTWHSGTLVGNISSAVSDKVFYTMPDRRCVIDVAAIANSHVLLINPPIVDLRVPWGEWIEPTGLLKIASLVREHDCSVRLLDCFRAAPERRQLDAAIDRDGQALNRWRFGLHAREIVRHLALLRDSGWVPDHTFITTLSSCWWHGIPLTVESIRSVFPATKIIMGGVYPMAAPSHAARLAQDYGIILDNAIGRDAVQSDPAVDLYEARIRSVAVTDIARMGVDRSIAAIGRAVTQGATRIHLADHAIASEVPDALASFLEHLTRSYRRTRLHVLGEISAREIVEWPTLPGVFVKVKLGHSIR